MKRIWAIARKELLQASRDPLSLAMLLGVPTMMLLLYGYAINFDVRDVRLAVQDRDKTAASRELAASFVNSTYFDRVADLLPGADLEGLTQRREAKAVLVIPEGYARDLSAGRTARVQLLLDGADANTATTVLGYAAALVEGLNAERAARGAPGASLVATTGLAYEPRVWYNPELKSTQFLVPGLTAFILMITAVISTALSVVREKERGTMEQLLVTSLRPHELLFGKTLPYLAISLTATVIILVAARVLFGVVVRGSYLDLFAATLVFLIGALGWGMLVSSLAESQAMAFQVGAVTSMLPTIFFSGFIFPIRAMPVPIQVISYAVPARYFLVILRGVILKGAGLGAYLTDVAFLALYATLVMGLAYVRLRRREI
jgi:ABC-2 type transport system permease protein